MSLHYVDIVFQIIVFVFAISLHESAHAWMANRCGDPTARMLGRITLNPIKHIEIFGTIILPLVAMLTHLPVLGWAKPTPVDPRNFRNPVRDDILTSVVGPLSNFLLVVVAMFVLAVIAMISPVGREIVRGLPLAYPEELDSLAAQTNSVFMPLSLLAYDLMFINVVLGIFNLIPVPPLDGSHVLRHFLPEGIRKIYDNVGMFGLFILVFLGGRFLGYLIFPVRDYCDALLMKL